MTELFDKLMTFRESEVCMALLEKSCGFSSPQTAASVYRGVASMIVSDISDLAISEDGLDQLFEWTQALSWDDQQRPDLLFGKRNHRVGGDFLDYAFPDSLSALLSALGTAAEIPLEGARSLLEITSTAALASLAQNPTTRLDRAAIATALEHKPSAVNQAPKLDGTLGQLRPGSNSRANQTQTGAANGRSEPEPVAKGSAATPHIDRAILTPAVLPTDKTGSRRKKLWLTAVALAVVALLGFAGGACDKSEDNIDGESTVEESQQAGSVAERPQTVPISTAHLLSINASGTGRHTPGQASSESTDRVRDSTQGRTGSLPLQ